MQDYGFYNGSRKLGNLVFVAASWVGDLYSSYGEGPGGKVEEKSLKRKGRYRNGIQ